jgi:hypothetical protein
MPIYSNYILSVSAASLLISGAPVYADNKADFLKLVQDSSEQVLVLNAAKQSQVVLENPCDTANCTIENKFVIYDPLQFDSSSKITAGAWKQSVSETGCGQTRLLNVVLLIDPHTHGLKAFPLFPGSTRADPALQKDALLYAIIAATLPENNNCKNMYVVDTEFLHMAGEPLEGSKGPPWDELWTLSLCGKKAEVTMHFIPDKTGTTIHTSPKETKFLPSHVNPSP